MKKIFKFQTSGSSAKEIRPRNDRLKNGNGNGNGASSSGDLLSYHCSLSEYLPTNSISSCVEPVIDKNLAPPSLPGGASAKNHQEIPNSFYLGGFVQHSPSTESILSSPQVSSTGSRSPADTTGSLADLSDSLYNASESENGASEMKSKASTRPPDTETTGDEGAGEYGGDYAGEYAGDGAAEGAGGDFDETTVEIEWTCDYEPLSTSKRYLDRIEEVSEDEPSSKIASKSSQNSEINRKPNSKPNAQQKPNGRLPAKKWSHGKNRRGNQHERLI